MADKSKLTNKDSEVDLKTIIDSVEEALAKGEKVQLIGFRYFVRIERTDREGRNPRTKEPLTIPEAI